jgi:hypothetical protein
MTGLCGDEANKTMQKLESLFSWTLYDLGAAKISPEKFGITRL